MTALVELLVGSTWTDITTDVYTRDEITITRGKANEAGQVAPTQCFLTLNNRAGKYSPRNPLSPYYGQIGRNTQIRVSKQVDPAFDAYSNTSGTDDLSWTHTPVDDPTGVVVFVWEYNNSGPEITGVTYGGVTMEREIFGLFTLGSTFAVGSMYFLNRDIPTGPQTVFVNTNMTRLRQASAITVTGGSHAQLEWTAQGYSNATPSANPVIALPATTHRAMLLNTLLSDLDDGSSIGPGFAYTQLGEHDLGTEVVNVERSNVLDPASNYLATWTAASAHWGIMSVAVRADSYRFSGEVSSFPARWDTSGNDAWVPIEAAGILRRLGQGTDPAEAGLRAFILSSDKLFRYWPLSGSVGTQYSLDIAPVWGGDSGYKFFGEGTPPPSFRYGEPMGSEYLGTGMALFHTDTGWIRGNVGNGYNYWAFDFVFQAPELGELNVFLNEYEGGFWTLDLDGGTGIAQVSYTDPDTGPIGFSPTGVLPELQDDQPHHVRIKFLKNGTATDWALYIDGNVVDSGTQPSYVIPGLSIFRFGYTRTGTQTWVNLAHVAVWADSGAELWPSATAMSQAAQGYVGETAGERIKRIADLAGHTLTAIGTLSDTAVMGPQFSEAMLTQMRDAEGTDLGVLAEPRDALGLLYRTHRSLYNQSPTLTLQYDGGQVSPPFEPVDDDRLTRNDVTAVRREGDSYRVQQTTGALSVSAPPDGVGRYKDETTVNVETDDMLPAVAGWLLHLGTLDEARFPSLRVNLAAPDITPALEADVLAVDIGDRIVIQDADAADIYDDVSLLVLGYTETIGPVEHTLTFNCAPGTSYEVIELDDPTSRVSSGDTSELFANISSTATSMTVDSVDNVTLWTTDAGQMPIPIMVAGEEMSVTAISGTTPGSAQTFTVTRSVNGVVKAQDDGAQAVVRLKRDAVVAL